MKLTPQDWQKLRTPLLILALVLSAVVALIVAANYYQTTQEQALQTQQSLLNAARQRYQSSGQEKDMIIQYLPLYQTLINKGFVGEERRIEWVDQLRAQHKLHKLFGIRYQIEAQSKYSPNFAQNLGGFVLNRSVMQFDLDMLHEGDVLQLTESLANVQTTPFMLRDCEITRLNNSASLNNQLIANLHAQCELDWLTLREPLPTVTP